MYSRLEHHERNRLLKQIILFFAATVALSAVFLFLILPAFIRILAFKNLGSKIAVDVAQSLPSRPFLSTPFDATASSQITMKGTAQAKQKVILLQNGAQGPETEAKEDGTFEFSSVTLETGDNTFSAVSENTDGTRSNPSNQVSIALVKDAPKLEISEPANDSTVSQRKLNPVTVKGKTAPGNKVYINDRIQFVSADGSFTGKVQLNDGENTIVVKAVNAATVETIQEIKVSFQP